MIGRLFRRRPRDEREEARETYRRALNDLANDALRLAYRMRDDAVADRRQQARLRVAEILSEARRDD